MRATAAAQLFACAFLIADAGGRPFAQEVHAAATATAYPDKAVRWIVTVSPGGGVDFMARLYGQKVSDVLKQPVVVDNRPGATGTIAMQLVARAAPDGYTAVVISVADLIIAALTPGRGVDPIRDFAPVSLLGTTPLALVIHPSLNAGTLAEFIALVRRQPGRIHYASGGTGGIQHLATELFKHEAKVDLAHVPYKGTGPGVIDLLAGHVQVMLTSPAAVLPHVKAGRLRALAIMGKARSPAVPDLPTFAESGLPGVDMGVWYGLLAPAHTSPAIVGKLAHTIANVARMPDVREKIAAAGAEPAQSTPAEFGAFLRGERDKLIGIARNVDIRLD
jgi:tripartite-type tricarboxylate transporter receptor subunit TctC